MVPVRGCFQNRYDTMFPSIAAIVLAVLRLGTGVASSSTIMAAQAFLTILDLGLLAATGREWERKLQPSKTGRKCPQFPLPVGYAMAGFQGFCGGAVILTMAAILPDVVSAGKTVVIVIGTSLFLGVALERHLDGCREVKDSIAHTALAFCLHRDLLFQILLLMAIISARSGFPWLKMILLPFYGLFMVCLGMEAFYGYFYFPGNDAGGRLRKVLQTALPELKKAVGVTAARLYRSRGKLCLGLVLRFAGTADRATRKHVAGFVRSTLQTRYPELDRVIVLFRRVHF